MAIEVAVSKTKKGYVTTNSSERHNYGLPMYSYVSNSIWWNKELRINRMERIEGDPANKYKSSCVPKNVVTLHRKELKKFLEDKGGGAG